MDADEFKKIMDAIGKVSISLNKITASFQDDMNERFDVFSAQLRDLLSMTYHCDNVLNENTPSKGLHISGLIENKYRFIIASVNESPNNYSVDTNLRVSPDKITLEINTNGDLPFGSMQSTKDVFAVYSKIVEYVTDHQEAGNNE